MTMTTPDSDAQRKRIEALQADPAAQDLAASARPRAPAPEATDDAAGKAAMAARLARLAEDAGDPEREAQLSAREADSLPAPRSAKRERPARKRSAAPVPAKAVTNHDRPLILARQFAHVSRDAEPYYLARFNGPAHRAGGQLLFGFEHPEMDGPTLPTDVWTLALADAEKRGPGLPAALRIFLASVVHVPLPARHSPDPFTPPVMLMGPDGRPWTLRHFLGLVYARTGRLPRPNEYWPVLWGAREVLHDVEVPYEWNGRLWSRPVLRLDWPQSLTGSYDPGMLDEPWPVSVHLPPGDGSGAPVNWQRLRQYMTRDAAAARALINLAYRWHIEGKRLMPAPGARRRDGKAIHWLQRRDPKLYDRITDHLAEQLCFPPGTGRSRRRDRIADAHKALERLVKAGDAVPVDGRLLPPPSSRAQRDGNRAQRDGNRAQRDGNRALPANNCRTERL